MPLQSASLRQVYSQRVITASIFLFSRSVPFRPFFYFLSLFRQWTLVLVRVGVVVIINWPSDNIAQMSGVVPIKINNNSVKLYVASFLW